MANSNPHQARAGKRRAAVQRAGSPDDLRAIVWTAILAARDIVADAATDPAERLRAVHAISQAAGNYLRLVEATEFDARLRAVEDARANEGTAP